MDTNIISLNDPNVNESSTWRRLIFFYTGGEKTILTIPDMDNERLKEITKAISQTDNQFVWLNLGTTKDDVIFINKDHFLFMMSSIVSDEEVRSSVKKERINK